MKMTPRERVLVVLLLAVFLMWLEYTYLLKDLWASYELTQTDLVTYEQKLKKLEAAPSIIKNLDNQVVEIENLTYGVLEQHFTTTDQEEVILLLTDLSENTGVAISDIGFSQPVNLSATSPGGTLLESSLYYMPVDISFEGTFESMMVFLKKIWGFQKRLVIDQLNLGVEEGLTLNGTLSLQLYYTPVPEGIDYQDNLYQWMIDDTFFKGNPFSVSSGAADFRVNYIFTGGKDLDAAAYVPFIDIKGHWAENEINFFGENGYIKKGQNDKFGPDAPMTRGEFIIMMDGIYQWPVPSEPADLTQFTDYDNLGSYENAISKAVIKGLLGGYVVGFDDKTLRPRDPITYSDVEYMMKRIKGDEAFTWDIVAAKLLADKGITSVGITDKAAQMTKAEAVFLMTHFK
jgi:Tfp pilus assembly protein PilO